MLHSDQESELSPINAYAELGVAAHAHEFRTISSEYVPDPSWLHRVLTPLFWKKCCGVRSQRMVKKFTQECAICKKIDSLLGTLLFLPRLWRRGRSSISFA